MKALKLPGRLADKLTEGSIKDQESMVRDPRRARRLMIREGVYLVLMLAGVIGHGFAPDPWDDYAMVLVAWFAGRGALLGMARAGAFKSGWLDGRGAMVNALSEALHRGMTPSEWLEGEYVRDMATMGIDVDREGERDV